MKKSFTLIAFLFLFFARAVFAQNQNVGIGTITPDASSLLEMKSTNKGVLVPRMTTTQRLAITTPANALLVYDINAGCFFYYNGTTWVSLCGNSGIAGPTGATGPQGADGSDGIDGPGYLATSTTQNTIGLGSKTFITQTGLAYLGAQITMRVISASRTKSVVNGGGFTSAGFWRGGI